MSRRGMLGKIPYDYYVVQSPEAWGEGVETSQEMRDAVKVQIQYS